MNGIGVECPKVVFWFRVYAGCMTALYGLILLAGIVLLTLSPSSRDHTLLILGAVYAVLGLIFGVGFGLAFVFRPSPFSWVYSLVLICIGFSGCPTIAASIPLLIFWIKPETKRYFGKS